VSNIKPALVIGGGVAGAALAAELARSGRPVVLLERTPGPHDKVCGEFLSGEAVRYLEDLNIDPKALGAVSVEAVRVCSNNRVATARLPFPALSLSRRVLDEAVLQTASAFGVDIRRGTRVRTLSRKGGAWSAQSEDGGTVSAESVFLATGKHDLRDWRRPEGSQSDLVAFKLHWRLEPSEAATLDRNVELILFPGGYAGLEPVDGGIANLCLVVRRKDFEVVGQTWSKLLRALRSTSSHLDRRLAGATPCWERPLAIASIPYGYVRTHSDGLWYLGDQAAVIPSFSGDGMAIALHSARLAASYYVGGKEAAAYQWQLARDIRRQVRQATLLSRMAVHPTSQSLAAAAARVPGIMPAIARATRVSNSALRRAGLTCENRNA
jgi:flavin-dependent dehydrogenase